MASSPATTHAQRALIELRQRILGGALAGGTRLYEVALAEELNISRTPVRAALSQLVEEGLLERPASGGFFVRGFARADVEDTIELRGVLEGIAARMAAERGADAAALEPVTGILSELDACFRADSLTLDFEAYARLNARFHDALARLSGSDVIIREIERVTRLPFASPSAFLAGRDQSAAFRASLFAAQEQHRALVDAITRREGARAEAIAREHARAARRNVELLFDSRAQGAQAIPPLVVVPARG